MRTLLIALFLTSSSAIAQVQVLPSRQANSPYAPGTPRNPYIVYDHGWPTGQMNAIRPDQAGSQRNPYLWHPMQPAPPHLRTDPVDDR